MGVVVVEKGGASGLWVPSLVLSTVLFVVPVRPNQRRAAPGSPAGLPASLRRSSPARGHCRIIAGVHMQRLTSYRACLLSLLNSCHRLLLHITALPAHIAIITHDLWISRLAATLPPLRHHPPTTRY